MAIEPKDARLGDLFLHKGSTNTNIVIAVFEETGNLRFKKLYDRKGYAKETGWRVNAKFSGSLIYLGNIADKLKPLLETE